jgi:DNA-binding transcriptional MerR regulator
MESIGSLSRRTGVPVKTIRYYSEIGLVPETRRTRSGYRHYDGTAVARLELVRALRELGLDLSTIRSVLDRRAELAQIAAAQVEAIDAQIRLLRLRRAILRRLAAGHPSEQEVERVHQLAHASAEERRRIVNDFLDHIFAGLEVDPRFEARFRQSIPQLPDDPTDAQVDAWVELAGLVNDPRFRARIRQMTEAAWGPGGIRPGPADHELNSRMVALADERVGPLVAAGADPAGPEGAALADELVADFARTAGREDTPEYRREVLDRLELGTDPRAERYWQLIGVINGWPPMPPRVPAFQWLTAALGAHL